MSSFSLGLALLSSLLTFTNFLILHWTTIICCACVSFGTCMSANLTPLQLFANVLCLLFVYSAFLWYYPLEPFSIYRQQRKREYLRAQILLGLVLLVSAIFSATSVTLYYGLNLSAKTLSTWGRAIGILSAIVVIVQWTPQIFTTFQLGSAGSLSVVMLLIQLPGCLLTVFFQAVIGGADFTTWGPYLISAINVMILIIMCLVFWIRNRNRIIQENFDILLSEDEHIVYEYDQDNDMMARKTYGSFSKIPAPSHAATPISQSSETPRSAKIAWSLSDRNGFKGKLSAASFITSGTTKRTKEHLSGKDLLGTSKGQIPMDLGLDENDVGFSRWEFGSSDGFVQPPPDHHRSNYNRANNQNGGRSRMDSTPSSFKYLGSSVGTGNFQPTPSSSVSSASRSARGSNSGSTPATTPQSTIRESKTTPTAHTTAAAQQSSSFSNSMGLLESVATPFLASTSVSSSNATQFGNNAPSSFNSPLGAKIAVIEEESDSDDINFTEDPLNADGRSLDTPHGTLDKDSFPPSVSVTPGTEATLMQRFTSSNPSQPISRSTTPDSHSSTGSTS